MHMPVSPEEDLQGTLLRFWTTMLQKREHLLCLFLFLEGYGKQIPITMVSNPQLSQSYHLYFKGKFNNISIQRLSLFGTITRWTVRGRAVLIASKRGLLHFSWSLCILIHGMRVTHIHCLSSETLTALHRNWLPFIPSINRLSRQIRLLLRSSRNPTCVIALSSRHLWGVRSWMQITREAFFSLFDRDGMGGKKMLVNSSTLHINQEKIRIREEISDYKFRPNKLSSISFQFKIICKTNKQTNHCEILRGFG